MRSHWAEPASRTETQTRRMTTIGSLGVDILEEIMKHAAPSAVARVFLLVSKGWKQVAESKALWNYFLALHDAFDGSNLDDPKTEYFRRKQIKWSPFAHSSFKYGENVDQWYEFLSPVAVRKTHDAYITVVRSDHPIRTFGVDCCAIKVPIFGVGLYVSCFSLGDLARQYAQASFNF